MPLLVCPNDNATMQTVQRNGVEFDFCPVCRGVWLDRGELEKLMAASVGEGAYDEPPPREPRRQEDVRRYEDERRYDEDRRYDDRRARRASYDDDDDDYRYRKKKGFSLFDIFD